METIKIIKDKSALDGTAYIELSLGKYKGKHWEDTSLFFDEETFGYIEHIFEKHIPNYDHYSMNDADEGAWREIIQDLIVLVNQLESSQDFSEILGKVGFAFSDTRDNFQNNFNHSKVELVNMVNEIIHWSKENIKKYGYIAVLGL